MAARTADSGLSSEQLQSIRDTLAAGRKPRVVFTESAGQIAGQVGQVVELTDPAVSDEWVVVRFGRDELPFSPVDLTLPPRGRRPEARSEPEPVVVVRPEPEFKVTRESVPAARPVPPSEGSQMSDEVSAEGSAGSGGRSGRRAGRGARPKPPPGLTVTLAYADGEWTVAAAQGSRSLAKPYLIKPAEALRMVGMIDVPGVQEAVEQILAAERDEAQRRAEKLRAELAEVESRLAELRDAG